MSSLLVLSNNNGGELCRLRKRQFHGYREYCCRKGYDHYWGYDKYELNLQSKKHKFKHYILNCV